MLINEMTQEQRDWVESLIGTRQSIYFLGSKKVGQVLDWKPSLIPAMGVFLVMTNRKQGLFEVWKEYPISLRKYTEDTDIEVSITPTWAGKSKSAVCKKCKVSTTKYKRVRINNYRMIVCDDCYGTN